MKKKAEDAVCGYLRWSVNTLAGIYSFDCTSGCPVHVISTADGSHDQTTMPRQVGRDKTDVPAPNTAKACNAYMQGVDRHDQLRAHFSLMKRHGFKKWYVKMWLALIDIALTNASICYLLTNQELKRRKATIGGFSKKLQTFLSRKVKRLAGREGQFGSQNKDVDVYQPDYDSDEEGVEDE
jgi:hypothetical protein